MNAWAPGISVFVVDRTTRPMLYACLAALTIARRLVEEPVEIFVLTERKDRECGALAREFGDVKWVRGPATVEQLVAKASYGGIYFLDGGLTLCPTGLSALLPWRGRHIFAIGSRVVVDGDNVRTETGWTDYRIVNDCAEFVDSELDDDVTVRGHLYAKWQASLFRRDVLETYVRGRSPKLRLAANADVVWGIRAWQSGLEVLFCPASMAIRHGAISTAPVRFKFPELPEAASDALLERGLAEIDLEALYESAHRNGVAANLTVEEIESAASSYRLKIRPGAPRRGPFDVAFRHVRSKVYPTPFDERADKPLVVVVSPFEVYPPTHGGVVRIASMLERLLPHFRVVLLADEQALYKPELNACYRGLHAVHHVGRSEERAPNAPPRIRRILNHSHPALRAELRRIVAVYEPDVVQVEFVELSACILARAQSHARWYLTLHDVLIENQPASAEEDHFEERFMRSFDATIVCSDEDAALVEQARPIVVRNGTAMAYRPYTSSRGNTSILFAGPFRYEPNLAGIRLFLERVYPKLKANNRNLEIVILGGATALAVAREYRCFDQDGVRVKGQVTDVDAYLQRCALTINPLYATRGSSVKLIESLASGRLCISTIEGARGFLDFDHPALIVRPTIEDFAEPLERYLENEPKRLALEKPDDGLRAAASWDGPAQTLLELYKNGPLVLAR